MDKQEAMQTHRLLMVVAQKYANDAEDVDLSLDDLEQYNEVGVKPTDLHKKREDHENAVLALGSDLQDALKGEGETEEEKAKKMTV